MISEIPFAEYLAMDAVSQSTLKRLLSQSPAHCRIPVEETPEMAFGTAFHTLLLEPERFDSEYFLLPDNIRRGTKVWEIAEKESAGRAMLKPDDADRLSAMRDAVLNHRAASALLSDGRPEVSCFWTDADTGLQCKGRFDWLSPLGCIVDIKTTTDASPEAFQRRVANSLYHLQAAMYQEGYAANHGGQAIDFVFIAVEKTPPYGVACYELPAEFIAAGSELLRQGLESYASCKAKDEWPGYSPHIELLETPRWLR